MGMLLMNINVISFDSLLSKNPLSFERELESCLLSLCCSILKSLEE